MHVPAQSFKGGERSKDQHRTSVRCRRKENQKVKDNSLRNRIEGNWKQLRGSVRQEWGKLTHHDVEQIKGQVEVLAGKIQERYGVTEAEARKQIDHWVSQFQAQQGEPSNSDTSANEPLSR
jgi:uncharacterized protein YjbJ (UPF0337 family)